jgi:regulator of nucleoside diphosphate kinase
MEDCMIPDSILLTEADYFRISSLIEQINLEDLENEIARANIVDFPEIPPNLITMNTRFRYLNVNDNKLCEMTIVYPQQANLEERMISVAAPLGTALLGLREGDEIDLTFPSGQTKKLRILEILYQPEANDELHL